MYFIEIEKRIINTQLLKEVGYGIERHEHDETHIKTEFLEAVELLKPCAMSEVHYTEDYNSETENSGQFPRELGNEISMEVLKTKVSEISRYHLGNNQVSFCCFINGSPNMIETVKIRILPNEQNHIVRFNVIFEKTYKNKNGTIWNETVEKLRSSLCDIEMNMMCNDLGVYHNIPEELSNVLVTHNNITKEISNNCFEEEFYKITSEDLIDTVFEYIHTFTDNSICHTKIYVEKL